MKNKKLIHQFLIALIVSGHLHSVAESLRIERPPYRNINTRTENDEEQHFKRDKRSPELTAFQCNSAKQISKYARQSAEAIGYINLYVDEIKSLNEYFILEGDDKSVNTSSIKFLMDKYNKILSSAKDNSYDWSKGGGLYYLIKTSYDDAHDYGIKFNRKYLINKKNVEELASKKNARNMIDQFKAMNIPLNQEQIDFIMGYDNQNEEIINFFQSVQADVKELKDTTSKAEKGLVTFQNNLINDKGKFDSFNKEAFEKNKALKIRIENGKKNVTRMWNDLKNKFNLYTENYKAEMAQKLEKLKNDKRSRLVKDIFITIGSGILTHVAFGVAFKAAKAISPAIKSAAKGTKTAFSSAKKAAKAKGKNFFGKIARATVSKFKVAFGKSLTSPQRKYLIAKCFSNTATGVIPMAYSIHALIREFNMDQEMHDIKNKLEQVIVEEQNIHFYEDSVTGLEQASETITTHREAFLKAKESVTKAINGTSKLEDLFAFVINSMADMIKEAKTFKRKAEQKEFLEIQIQALKCYWEKALLGLKNFESYVNQ